MKLTKEERLQRKELENKIKKFLDPSKRDLMHDTASIKAMLLINMYQTQFEQTKCCTYENNGVGFNSVDGAFMTSLCKQLSEKYWLSDKQLLYVKKRMIKYWKQLLFISLSEYKDSNIENIIKHWKTNNMNKYNNIAL